MDFSYLKDWKRRMLERTGGRGKRLGFLLDPPMGKNDKVFDLHMHTRHSDGIKSVRGLAEIAKNNKASVISFTDHDVINAAVNIKQGTENTGSYDGEIINGLELTSRLEDDSVEYLVYDYDVEKALKISESGEFPFINRDFRLKKLLTLITKRIELANKLGLTDKPLTINDFIGIETGEKDEKGNPVVIKIRDLEGMDITAYTKKIMAANSFEEPVDRRLRVNDTVYKLNFDFFNSQLYNYIRKSSKGQKFLEDNTIGLDDFAGFNRKMILKTDSPLGVDDSIYYPTVDQVVEFARKTGGVAILAHPFGYSGIKNTPEQLIRKSVEAGVDGIEVMHGFCDIENIEKTYKYCQENGLLITGGSDTHYAVSTQGNITQPGIYPSSGYKSKFFGKNIFEEGSIGTYNLHYIGSGAWRKHKLYEGEQEPQM